MPGALQARMEDAFGADFSAVRIHQGDHVTALGALAYTQGADIHFAPGQYAPHSLAGDALLGHELAHVVQQAQGRVASTTRAGGLPLNDSVALEREADEMGTRAARGEVLPPTGITAAPSQVIQGMLAREKEYRLGVAGKLRRTKTQGWTDTRADELYRWAKNNEQAYAFIELVDYDDWLAVVEFHPNGVTHMNESSILELAKTSRERLDFSNKAVKPQDVLSDQVGRVLDARDRALAAEQSLPLEQKTNYANAAVFADDRLLFKLIVPYPSGVHTRDVRFKKPTQHLNTEDDPEVQAEEDMTHKESEVRLLQDLDDQLTRFAKDVDQAQTVVVQIVSSYGACDNCKDRLDDFLERWQKVRVEYYYYTQRGRNYGENRKTRKAAYGWSSDQKAHEVPLHSSSSDLYKHAIDRQDLERRRAAKERYVGLTTPKTTGMETKGEPSNVNLLPEDKITTVDNARPGEQHTPSPPDMSSLRVQEVPEVKEASYQLTLRSKQKINLAGKDDALKGLESLVASIQKELELAIDHKEIQAGSDGALAVTIIARVPASKVSELRQVIRDRAQKGISYFVPINKKRGTLAAFDLEHDVRQL
jgi:hypothetical protein